MYHIVTEHLPSYTTMAIHSYEKPDTIALYINERICTVNTTQNNNIIPAANPAAATDTVPSVWPGAFGVFKNSRLAMSYVLWPYVGLILISIASSLLLNQFTVEENAGLYYVSQLIGVIIGIITSVAMTLLVLAGVRKQKMGFNESLQQSTPFFINYFLLSIVQAIIITGSLLLFVIPFFFVLPRVMLSEYYLIDKNMGPIEALKASWNETKGYSGKVWGVIGATFLMAIAIIIIIGIPLIVLYSAAPAILYFFIRSQRARITENNISVPVPPATPVQ